VSGATYSSNGIIKAVENALKKALVSGDTSSGDNTNDESTDDTIATITVTSTGENYNTATKKITVKVTPKKQTVKTKAGKKKVTVTLKKDTKATGYQIVIGTKKSLKGAKTVTVKSYKTYKKTISKLKAKKTYYVKARSYKTSGKTKLYGAYSTVKKVKTK
ncbi:MAG: FMN-binding protein, partial [Anaerostipes sp.]|nr:FMN-binding protein [Anaerostipes sp.]